MCHTQNMTSQRYTADEPGMKTTTHLCVASFEPRTGVEWMIRRIHTGRRITWGVYRAGELVSEHSWIADAYAVFWRHCPISGPRWD